MGVEANNTWFLTEEDTYFTCPAADTNTPGMNPSGGYQNKILYGYGMNLLIPPAQMLAASGIKNVAARPRLSKVDDPSIIPLIADNRGNSSLGYFTDLSKTNPRIFYRFDRIRHDMGVNILYCDGRVKWNSEEEAFNDYNEQRNAFWGFKY